MHLHLDPLGGIAGDMFAAALLDIRPELLGEVERCVRAAGLADDVTLSLSKQTDEILVGHRFLVDDPREHGRPLPAHHAVLRHAHDGHVHMPFVAIRQRIAQAALPKHVAARAIDILTHLAVAEAAVHGMANVDDVIFHEVGAQDSIADIVAAATLLCAFDIQTASVASLPLGRGTVKSAHGLLPVPAPATAHLLQGFLTHDDGIVGERVTPTGAAILKHLEPTRLVPRGVLRHTGIGWGKKRFGQTPNIVRALLVDVVDAPATASRYHTETVAVVSFEIDDQTAEDLAIAIEHLRALDGVKDIVQSAVFGKKGRIMTSVRITCVPAVIDGVVDACLSDTTTLGVRTEHVTRHTLRRTQMGTVKQADRPGGATRKLEADALKNMRGHANRMHARRQAEEPPT